MIDRVAKAIYDVTSVDDVTLPWERAKAGQRELHMEWAQAAIEAMREPTQQMRLAGIAEWSRPDPTPEHESTLVFNVVWRAMVDAALKETTNV
ncbi:hypothetical protein [Rhizobium leguminosarum]